MQLKDPRLDTLLVPGSRIVEPSQGIMTRSKKSVTERWTSVPVKVKILQMLVQEYQVTLETGEEEEEDQKEDVRCM